jgi:hypothetical protein
MILAYCLGERGLRSTTAWASAVGLVDMSNVALLYRLRQCGDWLTMLVGQTLAFDTPNAAQGRLIRLIDATTVPKAGAVVKMQNKLWRIHSAFDLPNERFGFFELTDERGGERLDRIPVVEGEIRIGDRAYLQPDRIGEILAAGADIVVRAGWKNARWLGPDGAPIDLLAVLRKGTEPSRSASWSPSRSRRRRPKRHGKKRGVKQQKADIKSRKGRSLPRNGSFS